MNIENELKHKACSIDLFAKKKRRLKTLRL